jgi:hypothetical protein
MVRLRRDKWFGSDGQERLRVRARKQASSTYQLARLLVLLLLVMLLMSYASDPNVYRNAFRQLGVPLDDGTAILAKQAKISELLDGQDDAVQQAPDRDARNQQSVQARVWIYVLRQAPAKALDWLARELFAPNKAQAVPSPTRESSLPVAAGQLRSGLPEVKSWSEKIQSQLSSWQSIDDPEVTQWLVPFQSDWSEVSRWIHEHSDDTNSPEALSLNGTSKQVVLSALDEVLVEQLVDASPWLPSERLAYLRVCQRVQTVNERQQLAAPLLQPILLTDQAKVYRGTWIRLRGTLAAPPTSHVDEDVDFGRFPYVRLWLKPSDGSPLPVCVHVLKDWDASGREGQTLEVVGLFAKRLAYSAKKGVEVAPVVIAADCLEPGKSHVHATIPDVVPKDATLLPSENAHWRPPSLIEKGLRSIEKQLEVTRLLLSSQDLPPDSQSQPDRPVDERLLRALFLLRRSSHLVDSIPLAQWRTFEDVKANASPFAAPFPWVEFSGVATHVRRLAIDVNTQDWFEKKSLFEVTVKPVSHAADLLNEGTVQVLCDQIPSLWVTAEDGRILQRATIRGMGVVSPSGARRMVASKVQWRGKSGEASVESDWKPLPSIPETWRWLAQQDWDLAQVDLFRPLQKQALQASESGALYSLMANVARSGPRSDLATASTVPITRLLSAPERFTLQMLSSQVHVIRVSRVAVADFNWRELLGQDHYYEIDGIADVGNVNIDVHFDSQPGQTPLRFEGQFPVTLVCRDIPECLARSTASDRSRDATQAQVWFPRRDVLAKGLFYRLWSYGTSETSLQGSHARQFGPLAIAVQVESMPDPKAVTQSMRRQLDLLVGILSAIGAATGLGVWLYRQKG